MTKPTPKTAGTCPDCGKNLYRRENESSPTSPEDVPYTFVTVDCEDEECGYWKHDDPDDIYVED